MALRNTLASFGLLILLALGSFLFAAVPVHAAPCIVPAGCTGQTSFTVNQVIYQGGDPLRFASIGTSSVANSTGISISGTASVLGAGGLTITNTGVTSIAGTANQITASAATGAVTLSIPSRFIFPLSFESTYGTTTYASSTALTSTRLYSTHATTSSLYITGLTTGGLAVDGNGQVYKSATTTAGTGLTYSGNAFNVNTSQNISTLSNLTSNGAILTSGGTGALSIYTGTSCTNQFVRSLSGSIVATCATVANTDLANSTISGVALGGTLGALSNDATLVGSSYTGAAAVSDWGIDLSNPNIWTGLQQFNGRASSTLLSTNGPFYVGTTSTTTIWGNATSTFQGGINIVTGGLTLGGITGSAQCLHVDTNGNVTGTGSDCGAGGGAVSSVSNADGTLTISPTTGAVVGSLNLGNANTWTALQRFSNASSSLFSAYYAQFGGTATTTITSGGIIGVSTTTPRWGITSSSSTAPQLTLTDASATAAPFNFRSNGNYLTFSTSSPTTFATTTTSILQLDSSTASTTAQKLSVSSIGYIQDLRLGTPLVVSYGGTGVSTLTGIAKGNGTSAFTAAVDGTDFTLIDANTCTNQLFSAVTAAGVFTCASINNAMWSGADLTVANGGTGLSTFGGTNHILYTSAADTLTSEAAFTYDQSTNTFTTDNGIISTSLRIPNGTGPTTDAAGEIAFDTDAWTRGAVQAFDGTANTYLVGVLASDAPSNGQVPQWNTGGTITWETPTGGGGAGSTHWATTSPWSGKYVLYPSDSGADLCLSASATSSCKFWFDVDNSIEYVGQYGSADSFQTFSSDGTATTSLGMDFSDGEAFKISLSSTLDTATVATILQNGRVGFGTTSPWGAFSIATDTYAYPIVSVATSTGNGYSQLFNIWATSTTQINTSALSLPDTSGVRVFIGGLMSYAQLAFNFAQLYIQGWYDQSDSQAFCDSPVGATAISADGVAGCGGFSFNEDGTGTLTALSPTDGGYTYGQLSTTAANDGAGVFLNAASAGAFSIATSTPIFAADARIASVQLATTSHNFYIGFTNLATAGTTYETRPTQGCYFTASSTEANWKAVSQNSAANITITDTGIASSSVITGTGAWRRFYVAADANGCSFFLQTSQSTDLAMVAKHTTNLPTSVLNAGVYMADTLSGAGALFNVKRIRAWWRDFIPAL